MDLFGSESIDNEVSQVLDGGWAWVIVCASFFVNSLTWGQLKAYGVILEEVEEVFETSVATAALVNGLSFGLTFGLAPVTSLLCNVFGVWKITMIGGFLAAFGISTCYFATDIKWFFVTYGLMFGLGCSFLAIPAMVVLSKYFRKRLPIASGFAMSGTSVGSFLFPLLFEALFKLGYNLQMVLLICGGITLNLVACASLYRPVTPKSKAKTGSDVPTRKIVNDSVCHSKNNKTVNDGSLFVELSAGRLPEMFPEVNTGIFKASKAQKSKTKKFHWSIFRIPRYILCVVIFMLFYLTYAGMFILLPLKAGQVTYNALPERDTDILGALLISLLSLTEVIFSPIWGILWTCGPLRKPNSRLIGFGIIGLLDSVLMFSMKRVETALSIVVLTVISALLLCGAMSPLLVVLFDTVGPKRVASAMGAAMLAQSLVLFGGPVTIGVLVDINNGDTTQAFALTGASMMASGFLCLITAITTKSPPHNPHCQDDVQYEISPNSPNLTIRL